MKKYITMSALSLVASALLVGCGGGSSSDDTTLETGYFIDAPVQGAYYETTSGQKGTTDQYGKFRYKKGDKVKFRIGELSLGEAAPQTDGLVTPETLANGNTELKTLLLRVLQALDSDNNPTNGITIPEDVVTALENLESTEVSISDLGTENAILSLNDELEQALDEDFDGAIDVDASQAHMHFDQSLMQWNNGHKPDNNMMNGGGNANGHGNADTQGGGQGNGASVDLTTYPMSKLTDDQKHALAYMWNEEKLAKDIYLALNEVYPTQQFYNIATRSETKHEAMVEDLVQRYDINITNLEDYTVNYSQEELRALPAGTYSMDVIQNLYDTLYEKGIKSQKDALEVGCMVEVTDVNDLNEYIDTAKEVNATDLVAVFEKLRAGSYNHYWAFDKALKNLGVEEGCASLGAQYAKTAQEYPSSQGQGQGH